MKCKHCGCELANHPKPKRRTWLGVVVEVLCWAALAAGVFVAFMLIACSRTYCGGPTF